LAAAPASSNRAIRTSPACRYESKKNTFVPYKNPNEIKGNNPVIATYSKEKRFTILFPRVNHEGSETD
jgi:hypothetical protein